MRKIHTLFFLLLSALVFHVSMKLIYQFGSLENSNAIYRFAYWYNVPQFHGNYAVFAPEPPLKREFFIYRGILNDGTKTKWFEDGTKHLQASRTNRFSADYKRWKIQNYLGFQTNNIYYRLVQNPSILHLGEKKVKSIAQEQIQNFPHYEKASTYSELNLNKRGFKKIKSVQFAYLVQYVDSNKGYAAQIFPPKSIEN